MTKKILSMVSVLVMLFGLTACITVGTITLHVETEMIVGETYKVEYSLNKVADDINLTWEISNPNIAELNESDLTLKALAEGTFILTARADGIVSSKKITVKSAEPEVPTHEHTACEICQKCTAEDCPDAEAKCPGHEVEPEQPAETVTYTMAYKGTTTTNMKANANNAATVGLDETLFTISAATKSQTNNVGLNKNGTMRLYAASSNGDGNELTIKCNEGTIVSIKIVFASTVGNFTVNGVQGAKTTDVYEVNGDTVVIKNTTSGASTQVHIKSIEITVLK